MDNHEWGKRYSWDGFSIRCGVCGARSNHPSSECLGSRYTHPKEDM